MSDLPSTATLRPFHGTLLALALAAGLAFPATAEERWVPLGPSGGVIRLLAQGTSDPGRLYAATERSGLFASRDGGRSWRSIRDRLYGADIQRLAVAPSNPDAVLAATQGNVPFYQVWRSEDGGATWAAATTPPAFDGQSLVLRDMTFDPVDARTAYAATDHGIYRSVDGGSTWHSWALPNVATAVIARAPGARGTWFAAGFDTLDFDGEIYRSDDGGATWREAPPAPFGLPEKLFSRAGALYAQKEGTLYRSTDRAAKVDPVHPDVLYAGIKTGGGSSSRYLGYRSVDGGSHWTEILDDGLLDVTFDPARPNVGFRLTFSGIDKTTDGGNRWRRLPNLSQQLQGSSAASILVDSRSGALYAGTEDRGVFRSTDSGRTFRRIHAGLPREPGGRQPPVGSLIQDAAGDVYAALPFAGVFRLNPGEGWMVVNDGLPLATFVRTLVADPEVPGLLYAGSIGSSVHRLEND